MLIVDDEEGNRTAIRNLFAKAGWPTREAANGVAAIAAARKETVSLVVMDIDMPGCDGFAAARALRDSAAPLSGVPILVYSAMSLSDAEIARHGMDGRIPKPCTYDQLVAAIEPWLSAESIAGAQRLAGIFGEAELGRLLADLRDQLAKAVGELDNEADPAMAHRIAGVAGTLGFAAVSVSWLALSEGDTSARQQARSAARQAIAAIDRSRFVAPGN